LPLLLSEVLANEPGSVTSLEFIELVARHPVREGSVLLNANGDTLRLPESPLDSGAYLVVCRDAQRFEAHFGDSSGVWGDSEYETYAVQEFSMSLPNGEGYVGLTAGQEADEFRWSGDAPDGTSYERVSDSLWQPTESSVGATPGRRNAGLPADFDWSLERMSVPPGLLRSGLPVRLTIEIRNAGLLASGGVVTVVHQPRDTLPSLLYSGMPGELIELSCELVPHSGLNSVSLELGPDDRAANNDGDLAFYADGAPVHLSEIHPSPSPGQPEWVELCFPTGSAMIVPPLALTDGNDTGGLPIDSWSAGSNRYLVLTADSFLFALAYPGISAPVVQPQSWPSLNNDGDALELLLQGAVIDRVEYPTPGSRRGVSYERIGSSAQWGWSVAAAGSTPGARNSIDVPYSDGIQVDVDPNPFAASQGELANFNYCVPFGAQAELRLFAGDGRLVRTLFERRAVVSGQAHWDGHADNGVPVPVGIYILQFRLFEPREQVYLSTVVVAR